MDWKSDNGLIFLCNLFKKHKKIHLNVIKLNSRPGKLKYKQTHSDISLNKNIEKYSKKNIFYIFNSMGDFSRKLYFKNNNIDIF